MFTKDQKLAYLQARLAGLERALEAQRNSTYQNKDVNRLHFAEHIARISGTIATVKGKIAALTMPPDPRYTKGGQLTAKARQANRDAVAEQTKHLYSVGQIVGLCANPNHGRITIKRVNAKSVTDMHGDKWLYTEIFPLSD